MISNHSINQVRERADIVDIISHFIGLKKRGSNYIANCPFHNERTPSFNVNPSRGIYKCFGCGEAGDAIQFVQSYEKFSFTEAIRWIAEFYHIELEETAQSDEHIVNRQKEESLRIIFENAADYFHKNLSHTETGRLIGMSYFRERGFNDEVIEAFRLGYALEEWRAYYDYALQQGFSKDLLIESGLISEKNDRIYDTYRGRIIFPIISNTGKVVGLGGRILNAQIKAPKYINSNESVIYNKSKILYGLYQCRQYIKNSDECILVEGYTDVISLYQHDVRNVVASSGTALTEGQLKLIRNLTQNLVILYDGDSAGIKAAIRGMQLATKENFNISIVLLPDGSDPDSYIKNHSREEFINYLRDHKKDIVDFQIDIALKNGPLDPKAMTELTHELAEAISQIDVINNFILKNVYIKKTAERLKIEEPAFLQLVNKYTVDKSKKDQLYAQRQMAADAPPQAVHEPQTSYQAAADNSTQPEGNEVLLLQPENARPYRSIIEILLKYGDKNFRDGLKVHEYFYNKFELNDIKNDLYYKIVLTLQEAFNNKSTLDEITLKMIRHEDLTVRNTCIELLLDEQKPHPIWDQQKVKNPYLDNSEEEDTDYIQHCESVFYYYEFFQISNMIEQVQDELKKNEQSMEHQFVLLKVLDELKKNQKAIGSIVVKK